MTNTIHTSKILHKSFIIVGILAAAFFCIIPLSSVKADTLSRQLELGMSGTDVSSLQVFLAKDMAIYPQGLITGYFGFLTKSAVSNFQSKNGIDSVGRVGPVTLAAINAQMGNGQYVGNAPVIGSLNTSVTSNSFNISWNTTTNTTAVLYYSTAPISLIEGSPTQGVTIGGQSLLVNNTLQTSHVVTLNGLQSHTLYYYVVYVRDGNGNENITWPGTFQTSN